MLHYTAVDPRPSSRSRACRRSSGGCSSHLPEIPEPQARALRAALALESSAKRIGSPSTRVRSASSAWRPSESRCSSSSTTHTGSTARLPKRSRSLRGGSRPSRSRSCLPCAKAKAPTSASRFPRSSWSRSRWRRPWSFFASGSARRSPRRSPATSPRRRRIRAPARGQTVSAVPGQGNNQVGRTGCDRCAVGRAHEDRSGSGLRAAYDERSAPTAGTGHGTAPFAAIHRP